MLLIKFQLRFDALWPPVMNHVATRTQNSQNICSKIDQGHLVKGEDTEAFSSPLWS
jgi:hypothetical protein